MFPIKLKSEIIVGVITVVLMSFVSFQWYSTSKKLDLERLAHKHTIAGFALKQAQANSLALETKIKIEEQHDKERQKADAAYQSLNDKYRAAVLRYKAANTISTGGKTNSPGGSETSPVFDGPGEDSLVSVPASDLMICAENTARLLNARDWVTSLEFSPTDDR